ncbi:MAG: hypothetical protein ACHQLA_06775, partial [Ignavibacteriales bacterium]
TLLFIVLQGCDSTEPNGSNLSLRFSTPSLIQKISDDTITLDTVKILLRDIKLGYETEPDNGENDGSDEISVKVGPFVVYLNLAGVNTEFAVSTIPAGSYNKIKFKIHKVEASETPPDPEFKEGDDSSLRYSVIVTGSFNSQPFIYKSRKSAHQKITVEEPIVVEQNTTTNLIITVDPSTWFIEEGRVLDPNNPENQNDIDNNIKDSFKRCYKDNGYDG